MRKSSAARAALDPSCADNVTARPSGFHISFRSMV